MISSTQDILTTFNNNKALIHAHLLDSADPDQVQHFHELVGISLAAFIVIGVLAIAIWVYAVYLLYTNWKSLPGWAQVLGLLGVIPSPVPVGPVVTIIVVLIMKNKK